MERFIVPDVPFLAGQRVMLAPGLDGYPERLRLWNGKDAGWVLDHRLSDQNIIDWKTLTPSSRCGHIIYVYGEDGHIHDLRMGQLLLIEGNERTAKIYTFVGGDSLRYLDEVPKFEQDLEHLIINRGKKVRSVKVWDASWRQKIISEMR